MHTAFASDRTSGVRCARHLGSGGLQLSFRFPQVCCSVLASLDSSEDENNEELMDGLAIEWIQYIEG